MGHQLFRAHEKKLEQQELLGRKAKSPPFEDRLAPTMIQRDSTEGRRSYGRADATQKGPKARPEHRDIEWLGEEVVGAGVEAFDYIFCGVIIACQDDHRHRSPGATQQPHDVEPAAVGKTNGQHDRIVFMYKGEYTAMRHACGEVNRMALLPECAPYQRGDPPVILHQQQLHGK